MRQICAWWATLRVTFLNWPSGRTWDVGNQGVAGAEEAWSARRSQPWELFRAILWNEWMWAPFWVFRILFIFFSRLLEVWFHTKWSKSEREKQVSYINAYVWNLKKWYRWTYLWDRDRDAGVENGHVDTGCGEGEGGMNWEIRIDIYTPPRVK